jgi:hypothetical protein
MPGFCGNDDELYNFVTTGNSLNIRSYFGYRTLPKVYLT